MGGRLQVRRSGATTLLALGVVLVLVLLPWTRSLAGPATALAAKTPATTVLHPLGDEAAPVPAPASYEVRGRASSGADPVVATLAGGLVATLALAAWSTASTTAAAHLRPAVLRVRSGRSPPFGAPVR